MSDDEYANMDRNKEPTTAEKIRMFQGLFEDFLADRRKKRAAYFDAPTGSEEEVIAHQELMDCRTDFAEFCVDYENIIRGALAYMIADYKDVENLKKVEAKHLNPNSHDCVQRGMAEVLKVFEGHARDGNPEKFLRSVVIAALAGASRVP